MSIYGECLEYCLECSYVIPGWRTQLEHDVRAVCWQSRDSVEDLGRSGWLSRCILLGVRSSTFPGSVGLISRQAVYNELYAPSWTL